MRERGRQAHAAQAPRWNAQAPAASLRFGAMGTVPKALVIGVAMLLVFLVVRYLLEFRRTLPFPATGDVHWYIGTEQPRVARLTLRARPSSTRYSVVLLDDWATGAPVAMIPVRAGETAVTLVPLGRYRMTIAKGTDWQGPGRLFGVGGSNRVVVDPMAFYRRGNQVIGHEIDLEVPAAGNLETAPALPR